MFLKTKLSLSLACGIALSGALVAPSHAETAAQKSARREIAALYQKASKAIMRKDLSQLAAMEAPDYQSFSSDGPPMNSAQENAFMRRFLASVVQVPKSEGKILSLKWRGPDVVVIAQNTNIFIVVQGSKKVRVETVDVSRDFWSRTAKGWQVRQVVHGAAKTWVDGKRVK